MTLTKTERKYLRRALHLAIDYDESLIDAHRVAYDKRNSQLKRVIPKEYRSLAAACRRNIAVFHKLLKRLDGDKSE